MKRPSETHFPEWHAMMDACRNYAEAPTMPDDDPEFERRKRILQAATIAWVKRKPRERKGGAP